MTYLFPLPDETGINQTKEIYRAKYGMEISDTQAYDILGRVMRHLYFLSELAREQKDDTPGMPDPYGSTSKQEVYQNQPASFSGQARR